MRRTPVIAGFLLLAAVAAGCGRGTPPPVTLHDADSPPPTLSAWGVVFAQRDALAMNTDVVPYALNMPLFSDYALKLRTFWIPPGERVRYSEQGPLEFPVGTILSKTFHYEKAADHSPNSTRVVLRDGEPALEAGRLPLERYVLIETRLLVRYAEGWRAFPYVWNESQDEAHLALAGDVRAITGVRGGAEHSFTYLVPDTNQCAACHVTDHASKALKPVGPKAWQLNRAFGDTGGTSQLAGWAAAGLLDGLPDEVPAGPNWFEPGAAPLDGLARAYLDANCAHCHNAHGAADTSALDLDLATPLGREVGVCKPPVAVGRGSGDRPYDIYPGRPDLSILVYRMQESDPAIAMPELGRSTVHAEAVELVSRWIASLDGRC